MQHSAQNGSGRREERVPLETLIELRKEHAEERLQADGLNVSIGGLAMRASFVPPLGALLECRFQCPPGGDFVCAQGEVMWSEWRGPHEGSFGVRFIELDTKSATTLRRYVSPHSASEVPPERPRATTLVIDGLGTSVEADLKLADETRIVLEQQLNFLQLGRGVEISVAGRRTERGRIASVELRHTHFDVPTLVLGILLDEAPERPAETVSARVAPLFSTKRPTLELTKPVSGTTDLPAAEAPIAARLRSASDTGDAEPLPLSRPLTGRRASVVPGEVRVSELPRVVPVSGEVRVSELSLPVADERPSQTRTARAHPELAYDHEDEHESDCEDARVLSEAEDDDIELDESDESDEGYEDEVEPPAAGGPLAQRMRGLGERVGAFAREIPGRLTGLRRRIEPALREQAESLDLPDAKTRLLMHLARIRAFLLTLWSRLTGRSEVDRHHERVPRRSNLRMQRSTLPGHGPHEPARGEGNQRTRIIAATLALAGIALGVYALAPRSEADRIRVPERVEQPQAAATPEAAEPAQATAPATAAPSPAERDDDVTPHGSNEEAALELELSREAAGANAPSGRAAAPGAAPAAEPLFGDAEVPNGRTFTLRMNGPVESVEGEARDNGFVVRIPGRLALDRASPIASSHRSVSRAMILNRGGYAELTVDFVAGKKPRFQITGKDNALEVTLERLEP